jgi:hypothetical protein
MDPSWHLSKTLPITFITALVGQGIALVWFVSSLDNGIQVNTRDLVRYETRIQNLEFSVQNQAVTMGRMDENIKAIRQAVESMVAK